MGTVYRFRLSENEQAAQLHVWAGIIDKLDDNQVRRACLKCRESEQYMPHPARFLHLAYGLVDIDSAYSYAQRKEYPHPAVWHAASEAGMFDRRSRNNELEEERKFRRCYAMWCEKVKAGIVLEMPEQRAERLLEIKKHQENQLTPAEKKALTLVAEQALTEMKEKLRLAAEKRKST